MPTNSQPTEQKAVELKPCPFCGKDLLPRKDGNWLHPGHEFDGSCILAGKVASHDDWDTRAARPLDTRVSEMLVDDPDWVAYGIADDVIEAGIDAWGIAQEEMRERAEGPNPQKFRDWDEGMIVAAIFKAMLRASFNEGGTVG